MRVITGKYKGRKLIAPAEDTRPTLDRTKETLFNIINPYLHDAVVMDLFAGSGQLAIESLSRGARRAILCDNSKSAIKAIKANYEKIDATLELYEGDYRSFLRTIGVKADVVFVDPPYSSGYYAEVLDLVDNLDLLTDSGVVVCEHAVELQLPSEVGGLCMYDSRKIGSVNFSFYRRGV